MSASVEQHNLCGICYQPCLPPPAPSNPYVTVTVRYEDDVLWHEHGQVHRRCEDQRCAVEDTKQDEGSCAHRMERSEHRPNVYQCQKCGEVVERPKPGSPP